ncbi:MAG: transaldolase [Cellvibrionaceae bacterium]|jgi:transaldolase
MTNLLDQLKTMTMVVADTGDIGAIEKYRPLDATTNPSLLLKAAQQPQYQSLLQQSIEWAKGQNQSVEHTVSLAADKLAVAIGCEILSIIPGRVSTEVDARLSFDTQASVNKARALLALYRDHGISAERVLIKIAATWEGIRAAEILEAEEINCNATLLFSLTQAIACAEAKVFLISPFVGRILDWYKQSTGKSHFEPQEDPGVQSVTAIYHYYKQHGIDTIVMGASFRNTDEVTALAGCDRLTISPDLLEKLQNDQGTLKRVLSPNMDFTFMEKTSIDESTFRYRLNQEAMTTEKLSEGIRNFVQDQIRLENLIKVQL